MPTPKTTDESEQFFGQINESSKILSDLMSRIDERVKMLTERQKEIDELKCKIQNLEIKIESIQMRVGHHDHTWTQVFDSLWKIALMCIASYILYKLGISSPT